MRDSCIFYRSFYEAMNGLDSSVKANIYDAIFEYSLNGILIELSGLEKTIFTLIKPQLDANNKRFENGKKGGKPKQNETKDKPKRNQNVTKTEANNNVNDNVNVNKKDLETRTQIFKDECKTFIPTYGTELVKSFFLYWSEPNPSNTKMKYELQKTWELSRRLSTWSKNETNFKKPDVKPKSNLGI